MKIRITDLMDHYYDDSIIPAVSEYTEAPQTASKKKFTFSLHKPLLVAASLLLVLCGAFLLSLGGGRSSNALSQGDPLLPAEDSIPSEASMEEEEPVSVQESAEFDETEYTAVYDDFNFSNPQLTLHSLDGNGSLSDDPQIEFYPGTAIGYRLTAKYDATVEDKFIHKTIMIKDSNGDQVRSFSSTSTWPGNETEIAHQGVLPDPITVPGDYTLSVYFDGFLVSSVAFSIKDPMESYSAARDINGDGLLTAYLNIPYDFMGYETLLLSFTLDPETGEYTWKGTCPMATELLSARGISDSEDFSGLLHDEEFAAIFNAYQNHALETYKSNARLYFSDSTSVLLGAGDMIGYEKGVFSDTGKLQWLEEDYGISLDGLEPAFLVINDQRYDLN